jgi:hypothetical protein
MKTIVWQQRVFLATRSTGTGTGTLAHAPANGADELRTRLTLAYMYALAGGWLCWRK